MFKRVLVPIDDSKAAHLALKNAIDLCQVHRARLRIVHAIDYIALSAGVEGMDTETIHDQLKMTGEKLLEKARNKALKRKLKVDILLIESFKLTTRVDGLIVKAVKNWKADLVVVGMNEKEVLKKLFFGSHSEQIIHKITAPVLLVKSKK